MTKKEENEDYIFNPPNCWSFFLHFIFQSAISLISAIMVFTTIFLHSDETDAKITPLQTIQCLMAAISFLGFLIHLIKPYLTFLNYIFEEIPEKESFKKNICSLLRASYFVTFLNLMFFCIAADFNMATLIVFLMNMAIDFGSIKINFNRKKNMKILNFMNLLLVILSSFFIDKVDFLIFLGLKGYFFMYCTKINEFVYEIIDVATRKRIWILSIFGCVNAYLCYIILGNLERFVGVEKEVVGWMEKLCKLLLVPNLSKMVTYFI